MCKSSRVLGVNYDEMIVTILARFSKILGFIRSQLCNNLRK